MSVVVCGDIEVATDQDQLQISAAISWCLSAEKRYLHTKVLSIWVLWNLKVMKSFMT